MISAYMNAEGTIGTITTGNHTVVVEPDHPRWAEFLASGPAAYVPPTIIDPVPAVVSRFQARAALMGVGMLADAELAIAGAGPLEQLAWAEATEWRRDSPTIAAIAASLSLTDESLDDLFRAAAAITA